jgi:hypothetical protein
VSGPARPQMSGRTGHGAKLPRKQEAVIAALLDCGTVGEAAARVGVNERTVRRWLADEAFSRAYKYARAEVLSLALGALQKATGEAVGALRGAMQGIATPVQVAAARAVLEHALRATELLDLTERLDALEKSARERDEAQEATT